MSINSQDLIDDLQRISLQIQKIPSRSDYIRLGKYGDATFKRRFGSWNKALIIAFGKVVQKSREKGIKTKCFRCGKSLYIKAYSIRQSKTHRFFCSQSCSATYNNQHKTHGTRRSKLEVWIEKHLSQLYSFEICYNRKNVINSELDIYIPSLRLAFELNGIYHYKPIHGPEKLASIQYNDQRKLQACFEQGIDLCIIDVSKLTGFETKKAKILLNRITKIIKEKMT